MKLLHALFALLLTVPVHDQSPLRDRLPPLQAGNGTLAPDGSVLALVTRDGDVLLLDVESRTMKSIPALDTSYIYDCTWSSDSTMLAVLLKSGRVEFLTREGGEARGPIDASDQEIGISWLRRNVSFAAGENVLVVACGSFPTSLWSLETGKRIADLASDAEVVATAVTLSRDGELIALGDHSGRISVWRTRTGELVHGALKLPGSVNSLDFSPEADRLAIGARDCTVRLWDLGTRDQVSELPHSDEDVFGSLQIAHVRFSPDGRFLASTSSSFFEARIWGLANSELMWKYDYGGGNAGGVGATFSPDGKHVLLSLQGLVFDAESGELQRTLAKPRGVRPYVSTNGRRAWVADEGELRIFDLAEEEPLHVWALAEPKEK